MDQDTLAAIAEEVTTNPLYAGWVEGGNDQQIAEALSTVTHQVVGGVSRAKFSMWCGATGLRAAIADHATNPASPLRSVALTVQDFLLEGVAESLDFSDPMNQMMLGAWVQAGVLTTEQSDALLAMATTTQKVFGDVTNLDVARALGRNGVG